MKVYRDCLNGIPPFDGFPDGNGNINPAYFTIYDVFDNPIVFSSFTPLSFSTVPPTNNSPCAPASAGNACVQEALYETIVNLPPSAGGYYVVYQRCCRNSTILNLVNPGNVGASYWQHIPGPEVVSSNSSPRFTNRPPIYICKGVPIAFDHIASDPDGDSLVYSLCTPFNGLDACCPVIGTSPPLLPAGQCSNPPSSCPSNNTPQPYLSVPFTSPYSSSYPMASSPAVNIDPNTGFLTGVPTIIGQWVVGVCVSEYRNGQLIAVHHRDFQFNVINCPYVVVADIVSQTTTNNGQGTGYCNGFTISISNNSFNGTNYHWDFGVPGTLSDTSNIYNPTYTFPAPGDYTVTLYVNPNTPCGDTSIEVVHAHPLLLPDYIVPNAQCFNGNQFDFNGLGSFQGNGLFNWSFGTNATPSSANTLSVSNVTYNTPGVYPVTFTVSENGCTATVTKTIEVWQSPNASIGTYPSVGCNPVVVTFSNTSTAGTPMTYLWQFSDGTSSSAQNPTHIFSPPGVYGFSLYVSTNQNCIDTSKILAVNSITVITTPIADFSYVSTSGMCFNSNNFSFTNTSQLLGPGGVLNWNFGSNASTQSSSSQVVPNITYSASGLYPTTLIVSENNCSDTTTKIIEIYQNPVASIIPISPLGCDPMSVGFSNTSTSDSPLTYLWSFSDGTSAATANPTHIFTPPGIYTYTLTVITTNKCIDTSQITSVASITVNPSPVANFVASPVVTSIFEPDIFFFNTSGTPGTMNYYYDFADGSGSNEVNPMHTFTAWGDYYVTQTVTNASNCPNTIGILIRVLPEFRFWIPNAFTPGNKDNLNDVFKPLVIGVENYTFMIFNRWGELIYKTNDTEAGWNGTYKGASSPLDVYVWKCEFRNIVSKENESRVGHVTLVR
ncbi:MAG: PKD domain-containing protein [Burkholderiales bacterium]|nr:PKD domain-containing protein [Bacteroidia bacterium]